MFGCRVELDMGSKAGRLQSLAGLLGFRALDKHEDLCLAFPLV